MAHKMTRSVHTGLSGFALEISPGWVAATVAIESLSTNKWSTYVYIILRFYIRLSHCIRCLWTAINKLLVIRKSDLTDKIKQSFFQAAAVSIQLYGFTTWTLTKRREKKLDGNYTIMLGAILNKSWRQHPTNSSCTATYHTSRKLLRTRHAGHYWRSREELISDVLPWTPSHRRAKAGRPARTYIQQLCADTGCSLKDLPGVMDDRAGWRKRAKKIHADGTWYIYIYIYIAV